MKKFALVMVSLMAASSAMAGSGSSPFYTGESLFVNIGNGKALAVFDNGRNGDKVVQWSALVKANHLFHLLPAEGGRFLIQLKSSDKCVSLNGDTHRPGTNFVQWSCIGNATQAFKLIQVAADVPLVQLQLRSSGQCLTAKTATGDGHDLVQMPCEHGNPYQQFSIINVAR